MSSRASPEERHEIEQAEAEFQRKLYEQLASLKQKIANARAKLETALTKHRKNCASKKGRACGCGADKKNLLINSVLEKLKK